MRALVAAGLFLLLGLLIVTGQTAAVDQAVLAALRLPGSPGVAAVPVALVRAARLVTEAGPVIVRAPLGLLAAWWLRARGDRRAAAVLVLAVLGEELLVQGIKAIVHRPRPDPAWALVVAHSTSFPSGHAAGCMTLYPLLGWFGGRERSLATGRVGVALGIGLAILVGLTRVLLGVHWVCDVVAGWLLGGALALLAASRARRVTAGSAPS